MFSRSAKALGFAATGAALLCVAPLGSAWAVITIGATNFGSNVLYNTGASGAVSVAYYTSTNAAGVVAVTGAAGSTAPFMDPDPTYPYGVVNLTKTQANEGTLANAVGFTITTTAAIAPPAGQSAQLVININGNGAASPSKFYAPIAGLNGGPCGANGCGGLGGLPNPTGGHNYSAPFVQGMSVQLYPTDICADYAAQSSGQQAFGCLNPAPSAGPQIQMADPSASPPTSSAPLQLTWQIVYVDGGFNIQGSPADSLPLYFQFQASALPWTCPTDIGGKNRYFPGDGTITLDTTEFPQAYNTGNTPQTVLITVAQLEASPPTPTAPVLDPTFINSPPTQSSNPPADTFYYRGGFTNTEIIPNPANTNVSFMNTTGGSTNTYTLGFMVRDASGLINPLPSSGTACTISGVQTSTILTFLNQSKCFIATAAFRSIDSGPVTMLRQFRDQILLKNRFGTEFVHWYYHWSPPAAEWLMEHPQVRLPVLEALVPVEVVAWFMLHPVQLTVLLVFAISGLVLGIVFAILMRAKRRTQG